MRIEYSKEFQKHLESAPLPDEVEAIETANKSIEENGTVPHDKINWE